MRNLALMLLTLPFMGCTHNMPMMVSTTSLGPKEHPVAIASAESGASYIFGMGPLGDDSIQAAINNLRAKKDFDTIVNLVVDRRITCFPVCGFSLATSVVTRIYGTLVKYDDPTIKDIPLWNVILDDSGNPKLEATSHPKNSEKDGPAK